MICRSCLRAAARSQIIPKPTSSQTPRFLSASSAFYNATTPTAPQPATSQNATPGSPTPPAIPSTFKSDAKAQAKGELLQQQQPSAGKKAGKEGGGKSHFVKSSIPAGTPLKGLNFLKNQGHPIAMADDEYPDWLWTVLEKQEKKGEAAAAGDLFSKSKKQRRVAAKRLRKEQLANPGLLEPKIPIYEQTIDLPAGDGTVEGAVLAASAREELRKAMRQKRRATIKETNFLKAMR